MAIDFFQNELNKVWDRWNAVYGNRQVYNIQARSTVFLKVLHLGLVQSRISKTSNPKRADYKQFMMVRDYIHKQLNIAENSFNKKGIQKVFARKKATA